MANRIPSLLGRLALVAAIVLGSMLLGGVARAGGPTSVLLVSPETQSAAALYASDPAYTQLTTLLEESPVAAPDPDPVREGRFSVTVTWLVHDVSIWRLDRIFLDGRDSPWVVTQFLDQGEPVADGMFPGGQSGSEEVWHRPADPVALESLLAGLGLRSDAPAASTEPVPAAAGPASGSDDGMWWALPGAVVGAVVALLASGVLRRRVPAGPDPEAPAFATTGR